MSRYPLFDRNRVELRRLAERGHDMAVERLLLLEPPARPFVHAEFDALVASLISARQANRPVIVMMGGRPIKLGLSRFLVDLIEARRITHLATNGAGMIHDCELALVGGTSENVAKWIQTGQFGLWHETSRLNDIIIEAADRGKGDKSNIHLIGLIPFPWSLSVVFEFPLLASLSITRGMRVVIVRVRGIVNARLRMK